MNALDLKFVWFWIYECYARNCNFKTSCSLFQAPRGNQIEKTCAKTAWGRRSTGACKNTSIPHSDDPALGIPYDWWAIVTVFFNTYVNHLVSRVQSLTNMSNMWIETLLYHAPFDVLIFDILTGEMAFQWVGGVVSGLRYFKRSLNALPLSFHAFFCSLVILLLTRFLRSFGAKRGFTKENLIIFSLLQKYWASCLWRHFASILRGIVVLVFTELNKKERVTFGNKDVT